MTTTAAALLLLLCLVLGVVGYRVAQLRQRRRQIEMQRGRIGRMSPADLREALGIYCSSALGRLEAGRRSPISASQFGMYLDRAAIIRRRMAEDAGLPPRSEAQWRKTVLDALRRKQARRAAAGSPAAMQRIVPVARDAQAGWVALAVAGRKTMVCWSEREAETEGLRRLAPGERAVYVSEAGEPMLTVDGVATEARTFEDMDEATTLAEGEHASLAAWRKGRRRRFAAGGRRHADLAIVCETIRVVATVGLET